MPAQQHCPILLLNSLLLATHLLTHQVPHLTLTICLLQVPAQYRCPISQELMEDPVATSDGHTYERREIFRWLCTHNTSPLTGATLPNKASP